MRSSSDSESHFCYETNQSKISTDRQSAPRLRETADDKKIHSRFIYSRLFLFNKEFRQIQSVFYSIRHNADVE